MNFKKFFNVQKNKYPKNFVFIVGSGRCGTLLFKELFKKNPEIDAHHERNNLLTSFYQYSKFNDFKINYEYLFESFEKYKTNKKIYLESSSYLSLNIKKLYERTGCKIIILYRDPLSTCKSLMKKGWYNKKDTKFYNKQKNIGCHTNSGIYFHHNFSRLIPKNNEFVKWNNLPIICKVKWFWNLIYTSLIIQTNKIDKKNYKFINIDCFTYSDYLNICRWINIDPDLSEISFLEKLKNRPNKSKGNNSKISKKELKDFKTHYTNAEKILFR